MSKGVGNGNGALGERLLCILTRFKDGRSAHDLAGMTGRRTSHVCDVLRAMAAKGLVESAGEKRGRVWSVTEQGRGVGG